MFPTSWHWLPENGRIDMRPSSGMVWINRTLLQGNARDRVLAAVSER
jgi:hypothetical protein